MKAWELHHILQAAAVLTTAGDLPGIPLVWQFNDPELCMLSLDVSRELNLDLMIEHS